MLNQIVVVGRLVRNPEVKELEDGRKESTVTIATPRTYKNENGEYDTDFITCRLWDGIAKNAEEFCKKGDLIGIKGRVESEATEDGKFNMILVAEKITFLSSNQPEE